MTLFADKFEMIKLLGRGGMAEVWLAEQQGMRGFARRVVIKQMLRHLAEDREFVRRFEDEARIAALMNHNNVVRVEDFGEVDGIPFLVMEFIDGEDLVVLAERAQAQSVKLPMRLVLQIGSDIARGLHAVHHLNDYEGNPLNVVHRDVSPQNIMLDRDGRAKLLDFGVARAATNKVKTRVGILKGKIAYFSPEQSHGEPLDGRSDQFALAVVLWELLTGFRLFLGSTDIETLRRVRRGTIPELRDECPEASDLLVESMAKAMHEEPLSRFIDGNSFAAHLDRCLLECGGRLEGAELESALSHLVKGDRKYLPSIPLPGADEDTSFSTVSDQSVRQTNPRGEAIDGKKIFDEDALTVVSQPGFLANFEEDDTLLSSPSIPALRNQALRDLETQDQGQTRDDLRGRELSQALAPEVSKTRPTQTVDELQIAAEYTEHASLGGPVFSIVLVTVILALGAVGWFVLN